VRDLLIHRSLLKTSQGKSVPKFTPNDVDFATSARPDKIISILEDNGLSAFPIGIKFGTIQTVIDDMKIEITTFRSDELYTAQDRKPIVKFGSVIEEDLARRDFTFNAIAMSKTYTLIDPFRGHRDLLMGLIDTPLDPDTSFSDDPLRLLRACRFSGRTSCGAVTERVLQSMKKMAHKIKKVSAERIFEEMSKILLSDKPSVSLNLLRDTGILAIVFPELQVIVDFKNNQGKHHSKNVWEHTLGVVEQSPAKLASRWAALFHDIAKPQTYAIIDDEVHFYGHEKEGRVIWDSVARRLKTGNKFQSHVGFLVENHMALTLMCEREEVSEKAMKRLFKKAGDKFDTLFGLSYADITTANEKRKIHKQVTMLNLVAKIIDLGEKGKILKLKLPKGTGNVVAKVLGIKPGPQVGKVLAVLEAHLIDDCLDPDSITEEDIKDAAALVRHFDKIGEKEC